MLSDLKDLFTAQLPQTGSDESTRREEVRYAAAALLIICAKSDFESHPEEQRTIAEALARSFALGAETVDLLMQLADEDSGTRKLQDFTALVNAHYSEDEKLELIEHLWRVAFADGRLDVFEVHYVSRVAFLIRISQEQVQRCRAAVESGEV